MPIAPSKAQITGLVLCGGAAHRMGGADKGLIHVQGKPLVDIAIHRLKPQVQSLLISANRNLDEYAKRGFKVISDMGFSAQHQSFEGPLAGILAGLETMTTEWLMVVPCDCPRFPTDVVASLCQGLDATHGLFSQSTQHPGLAVHVKDHPVFALVSGAVKPSLEAFLASGQRRLGQWLGMIGATAVAIDNVSAFQNMNTPQDLSQLP